MTSAPDAKRQPPRARTILTTAAKIAIVGLLLYFLFSRGFISVEQTAAALRNPVETGTAVGVMFFCVLLGSFRWTMLLRVQQIRLSQPRALQLTLVGNFFNVALPGSVSGDLVKAFYLGREAPGRQARAFGAILFDRVMGLSALLLVSAGAFLVEIPGTEGNAGFAALRIFVLTLAAGVAGFYAYLLLVPPLKDPLRRVFVWLEGRVPKFSAIRELYDGLRDYHGAPLTVLGGLLVSVVIHALIGVVFFNFAHAVGERWMTLQHVYATAPSGMVVTTIPVGPAGVGTGHLAFAYLFKMVGSQRGADVFTLYAAAQILIGLIGGLVYAGMGGRRGKEG